MATTDISSSHALRVQQWDDKALHEYLDILRLKPYMGTGSESMIQVKENLNKMAGDKLTLALVGALSGPGIEGEGTLQGNEESLTAYDYSMTAQLFRNALRFNSKMTLKRTAFDYKDEARPALTDWLAQKTEDKMFEALAALTGTSNTTYGSQSEATKDAYLAANADRFLFGAAVSNNSSNDHSSSLANVDSTTDILTTSQITLAKRLAQLASPKIRPLKVQNGEEWYVMFVHPLAARDLKAGSTWLNAQQYAMNRGSDNPLFTGMLGTWDGVILVESPKCLLLDNVGASTSDVSAGFLCGAQAMGIAYCGLDSRDGSKVAMIEETFDYEAQTGIAIESCFAHGKAVFNSKQHGVVTVYSSAVAD